MRDVRNLPETTQNAENIECWGNVRKGRESRKRKNARGWRISPTLSVDAHQKPPFPVISGLDPEGMSGRLKRGNFSIDPSDMAWHIVDGTGLIPIPPKKVLKCICERVDGRLMVDFRSNLDRWQQIETIIGGRREGKALKRGRGVGIRWIEEE